jgi:hypothetical protein
MARAWIFPYEGQFLSCAKILELNLMIVKKEKIYREDVS